jgi:hypothetical protein
MDQMAIVVLKEIVVKQVIWYEDWFFIFGERKKKFSFRVSTVYKDRKEKKVKVVQLVHK